MMVAEGRFYYMAPAYPMLFAGGAVVFERLLERTRARSRRAILGVSWLLLGIGAAVSAILMLPLAPINSPIWKLSAEVHDNFREQLGWHELTNEVARIYHSLPETEQATTGILARNYGEAGAINLYGPSHGLPAAISGVNSHWYRGYGDPPPDTLIVLGGEKEEAEQFFRRCEVAGRNTNRYGVENEESRDNPLILLCRERLFDWHDVWPRQRSFG
jgi:hypothetical protein